MCGGGWVDGGHPSNGAGGVEDGRILSFFGIVHGWWGWVDAGPSWNVALRGRWQNRIPPWNGAPRVQNGNIGAPL